MTNSIKIKEIINLYCEDFIKDISLGIKIITPIKKKLFILRNISAVKFLLRIINNKDKKEKKFILKNNRLSSFFNLYSKQIKNNDIIINK